MSQELVEEIDAIEAIFPDCVEKLATEIINFTVPNHDEVVLQMSFPSLYPDEKPSLIQVITKNAMLYPDPKYIEENIQRIIDEVYNVGDVIVFELLGEVEQFLEKYEADHAEETRKLNEKLEQLHIEESQRRERDRRNAEKLSPQIETATKDVDYTEGWYRSDPIVDRGSTFIAYAREAKSVEEAKQHFEVLKMDRKIAKSTHNMNAWRIKSDSALPVTFQDCDDDGETAAGLRMLHLLTVCLQFSLKSEFMY